MDPNIDPNDFAGKSLATFVFHTAKVQAELLSI